MPARRPEGCDKVDSRKFASSGNDYKLSSDRTRAEEFHAGGIYDLEGNFSENTAALSSSRSVNASLPGVLLNRATLSISIETNA